MQCNDAIVMACLYIDVTWTFFPCKHDQHNTMYPGYFNNISLKKVKNHNFFTRNMAAISEYLDTFERDDITPALSPSRTGQKPFLDLLLSSPYGIINIFIYLKKIVFEGSINSFHLITPHVFQTFSFLFSSYKKEDS